MVARRGAGQQAGSLEEEEGGEEEEEEGSRLKCDVLSCITCLLARMTRSNKCNYFRKYNDV